LAEGFALLLAFLSGALAFVLVGVGGVNEYIFASGYGWWWWWRWWRWWR